VQYSTISEFIFAPSL